MTSAFRTDRFAAERAVLNRCCNLMGAVTIVKGTHDLRVHIPADRAWTLINNQVAGMTLILPVTLRYLLFTGVLLCQCPLLLRPVHTQ